MTTVDCFVSLYPVKGCILSIMSMFILSFEQYSARQAHIIMWFIWRYPAAISYAFQCIIRWWICLHCSEIKACEVYGIAQDFRSFNIVYSQLVRAIIHVFDQPSIDTLFYSQMKHVTSVQTGFVPEVIRSQYERPGLLYHALSIDICEVVCC